MPDAGEPWRVLPIVEGHGEVEALPLLLRRLGEASTVYVEVLAPFRRHRSEFENPAKFGKALEAAAIKLGARGTILVLFDADEGCARALAEAARSVAAERVPHRDVAVVVAVNEFESWFAASAETMAGYRGFPEESAPADPEAVGKAWVQRRIEGYQETLDQAKLAARIDLILAATRSRSFAKLAKEVAKRLAQ